MVQRLSYLAAACALSLASAAVAQPSPEANAAASAASKPAAASAASNKGDPNRRICRAVVSTGSRLGKAKICKTAREWEEQSAEDRRALEKMQISRTPDQ